MRKSILEKFCCKVSAQENILLDPSSFRRNYPGYWQRKQGAWSWTINEMGGARHYDIGSQWSISELLNGFEFNGREFFPKETVS